ncbi:hypothetical protein F2P81_020550 [Scophthalmus maximus]|uniref:Uncharacterized protein n=1 Tax=Scophthalmus maximus TaxID=52904 RepID=A0A6A4S5H2_SCOMX|nr:hypothetical protein F2P81_020550 [Scophthalmus maximus]
MNATTASVLNQDVEIFAPRRVSCSGDDTSPIRLQIKRVCCKGKDTVTERTPLGSNTVKIRRRIGNPSARVDCTHSVCVHRRISRTFRRQREEAPLLSPHENAKGERQPHAAENRTRAER